ncbi:hypothetical protein AKJ51_00325 [candidate division MSBL1 archaeon SCGC-AAA382A20]|uniref:Histidine kinase/HSP90-like ATPase domain-containing protein n=1 Tax=candidate division MSBL1 archaeon SCGC-AAA382A20 TaxID=1698280 RepID=A0A133VMM1_9EURY|nr:hypothetical protein AKJ51_00325 [candidate division MSBL1 archaeon SCGC-AAA382A20]
MSSNRRFHTDSRLSENFTERGLATLTGQEPHKWGRYILKELLDNALEAVEEDSNNPHIDINIETAKAYRGWKPTEIQVHDNGAGIEEERVEKIFENIDKFGGTKRHYNLPTRGNIGNALMTILGIHGLVGNPLTVKSRDKVHEISVEEDTVSNVPKIIRDSKPVNIDGTEIVADLCIPGAEA